MSRLLLLSCSQRKTTTSGLVPAIDRYNGPMFQVLRRYCRNPNVDQPLTYILSAEYALIPADQPISHYDRKMTPARARELQYIVMAGLNELSRNNETPFDDVMVCLSSHYLPAIAPVNKSTNDLRSAIGLTPSTTVKFVRGSMGKQVASLYDWLYQAPPPPIGITQQLKSVSFHGIDINLTVGEIEEVAVIEAIEDPIGASRYESWYVAIGEQRIAPKWLLSILTGMTVSQFRTADARRVLGQLGIEIRRV